MILIFSHPPFFGHSIIIPLTYCWISFMFKALGILNICYLLVTFSGSANF